MKTDYRYFQKTLLMAVFGFNSCGLFAQDETLYCAKLRDGIIVVYAGQNEIDRDLKLAGGTVIKPDGSVIRKDGTQLMLEDKKYLKKNGLDSRIFFSGA